MDYWKQKPLVIVQSIVALVLFVMIALVAVFQFRALRSDVEY